MQLEPIPRRKLLKLGAFGAVALGAATALMFGNGDTDELATSEYPTLLVLSKDNAKTLLAMLQVVLPRSRVADDVLRLQVLSRIDEEFYFIDDKIKEDFCLALDVLEYLPIVAGQLSRFSKLSLSEREVFLTAMHTTRIDILRAIVNNCRLASLYVFYGLEQSWESIGYDGAFSKAKPLVSGQRQYYAEQVKRKSV